MFFLFFFWFSLRFIRLNLTLSKQNGYKYIDLQKYSHIVYKMARIQI